MRMKWVLDEDLPRNKDARQFVEHCREYGFGRCTEFGVARMWWVGRNASHEFYIAEKDNGVLLHVSGGDEFPTALASSEPQFSEEPTEEEFAAYEAWELEMNSRIKFRLRARRISAVRDGGYWGHW